jgi:hypothetical protein
MFDSIGLSFAVAEFRSGVFSGIFRQKSTKLDHISFGPIVYRLPLPRHTQFRSGVLSVILREE